MILNIRDTSSNKNSGNNKGYFVRGVISRVSALNQE